MFCPVCHRVKLHHTIETEYEILAEYAHGDGAAEIDFLDYVGTKDNEHLYDNCVNHENQDPLEIVYTQIDMALDLWSVAKKLGDVEWEQQLIRRLKVLSRRRDKLLRKKSTGKLS